MIVLVYIRVRISILKSELESLAKIFFATSTCERRRKARAKVKKP